MIDSVCIGVGPGVVEEKWQPYAANHSAWLLFIAMLVRTPRDCMKAMPPVPLVSKDLSQNSIG